MRGQLRTAALLTTALILGTFTAAISAPARASAVGPGISVRAALRRDLAGPVLVRGYLLVHHRRVRLCDRVVPERPDPCAGASLLVHELAREEQERLAPVSAPGGSTRSDAAVTVLGRVRGRVLRVSPGATA